MKGISEIIAVVLVIAIAIALVSIAYTWGLPLIEKRKGETIAGRVHTYFNPSNAASLQRKITEVSGVSGTNIFSLDADGIWTINATENSIQFMFFSKTTKVAPLDDWIPAFGYTTACRPENGTIGIDMPYITCARAKSLGNGYEISYKVWFRALLEPHSTKGQMIKLVPEGPSSSTGKYVRISRGSVQQAGDLTLIEVKINLG